MAVQSENVIDLSRDSDSPSFAHIN